MIAREPSWWYQPTASYTAALMAPLSALYAGAGALRHLLTTPMQAQRPVICVGNFTAGGTGKTPLALAVGELVAELGRAPWFLSRGYGGSETGPLQVDPSKYTAAETGDEPLLLARRWPTVIARDRRAGAQLIATLAPANAVIIMDDGLQNPGIVKNLSIAVVDAVRGFGNGRVIPAGPLRAPLARQIANVDMVVINGAERDTTDDPPGFSHSNFVPRPVLHATPEPQGDDATLKGGSFVAYAGIANPERFFNLVRRTGGDTLECYPFADHRPFSDDDARHLLARAQTRSARLITTEKDHVRLNVSSDIQRQLAEKSEVLSISLKFSDDDRAQLASQLKATFSL